MTPLIAPRIAANCCSTGAAIGALLEGALERVQLTAHFTHSCQDALLFFGNGAVAT